VAGMTQPKAARWLDLLAYLLQHRFPVTREEIYEHVRGYREDLAEGAKSESVRRKFERDKDELRALGIEIGTIELRTEVAGDEPAVGYRLRSSDFYLPYLELTPGPQLTGRPYPGLRRIGVSKADLLRLDRATRRVVESNVPALSAAAASARRKLEFDLPLPLASVERVLSRPPTGEGAKTLEVLQRAVAARKAVGCRYYAIGRDAEEARVIEPYGLFFNWGHWYAVARSRERDAMRVFRVDRMRGAEVLEGKDATFEVPASFSVRAYTGRAPWELSEGPVTAVRVRFAFPESRWVQSQGLGDPVEPLLDDGGAVLVFGVRDPGPFLRWLLTFRGQVTILDPETMASELAALRRRVAGLYAEGGR